MSSSDSYLLIASSALAGTFIKASLEKATDKQVLLLSRTVLLIISIIGIIIALDENSVIFKVVAFAWAGFGPHSGL